MPRNSSTYITLVIVHALDSADQPSQLRRYRFGGPERRLGLVNEASARLRVRKDLDERQRAHRCVTVSGREDVAHQSRGVSIDRGDIRRPRKSFGSIHTGATM